MSIRPNQPLFLDDDPKKPMLLSEIESQFEIRSQRLRQKLAETCIGKLWTSIIITHSEKREAKQPGTLARGSSYIGVSLNVNGLWQINFKHNSCTIYLASTDDLQRSVILYDIVIIQLKGLDARTNYDYNVA